jgi:hypothetical protein
VNLSSPSSLKKSAGITSVLAEQWSAQPKLKRMAEKDRSTFSSKTFNGRSLGRDSGSGLTSLHSAELLNLGLPAEEYNFNLV